jgi:hypothetical protein
VLARLGLNNFMSTSLGDQCRAAIKSATGDQLTDDQINEMTKRVLAKRAEMIRFGKIMDDPDAILKAVKQIGDDEKVAALIEKRSRAINVIAKKQIMAFIDQHNDDIPGALKALMVGKEGNQAGFAQSTEALIHAERSRMVGALSVELERAMADLNVTSLAKLDRDTNLAIAKEMARATGGTEEPTGNKLAETIGKIYAKNLDAARIRRNDSGAWTRSLDGFITTQTHDQVKIVKAGFEPWRDYILPRLDERTFTDIDPPDRDAFIRSIYGSLSSGVHLKSTGEGDWLSGFKGGTQNLAKRASQERSVHFKNAEAWFEYNERFGTGNIHEAVQGMLLSSARDVGLMKMWGTNPKAMFERIISDMTERLKDRDTKGDATALKQLDTIRGKNFEGRLLVSLFDQIDGSANINAWTTLANVGRNVRAFETMVKLTGSVISSFSDLFSRAATLEWNGAGYFDSLGKGLQAVVKGRPDLEGKELLQRIGAVTDGLIGDIASRFDAGDHHTGRMAKAVRLHMLISGQKYWTDALLAQTTKDLSSSLGFYADKVFGDLPEKLKISLRRYGIDETHWNYARANTVDDAGGRAHVVSDMIRYEPDENVAKIMGKSDASPKEIARFRDDFEQAWRSYFVGTTREAMTEPGAATRAIVTANAQPGTWMGEAARLGTQFKSFPVQFLMTHLNREINRGDSANWSGLVKLVLGVTAAGYLSGVTKDLLRGRSPKAPEDFSDYVKLTTDAFARGGGAGILGDILFNDYARNGGASGWNLLGPSAGSAADFASLLQTGLSDVTGVRDTNWTNRAIQVTSNHLPVVNLWYAKGAWEFLVLHGLQEAANPGYLGRVQRRMERENRQSFLAPTLY